MGNLIWFIALVVLALITILSLIIWAMDKKKSSNPFSRTSERSSVVEKRKR